MVSACPYVSSHGSADSVVGIKDRQIVHSSSENLSPWSEPEKRIWIDVLDSYGRHTQDIDSGTRHVSVFRSEEHLVFPYTAAVLTRVLSCGLGITQPRLRATVGL